MYLPKSFEETRPAVLHALIRSHPLGTWVALVDGQLVANPVPMLLHPARGECGTLCGHVALANPVAATVVATLPSIVSFQGPQAYITPSWYPGKQQHGMVVPTWNYAVVHAHGHATLIRDRDWLLTHVSELTNLQEGRRADPWQVSDAPAAYIERMLGAIVGVEIRVERLEGKWKASQNRMDIDRRAVGRNLLQMDDTDARAMARLVNSEPGDDAGG